MNLWADNPGIVSSNPAESVLFFFFDMARNLRKNWALHFEQIWLICIAFNLQTFFQVNTKDTFFFIFDSDLLDFDLQILDGSFSTHLNPG